MNKRKSAVKDIISKARSGESQNTRKAESAEDSELVNLGVKVARARRRHWAAESKRTGVSMTKVIVDALVAQFGEPE